LIDIVLVVDRAVSNDGRTFAWDVVCGDDTRIALWGFGLAFVPHDGLPRHARVLVDRGLRGMDRACSRSFMAACMSEELAPVL
jgi:hypothetical protein